MSEKVDKFCDGLKASLNKVEAQINEVKSNLSFAAKEGKDVVNAKLAKAKADVEAKKQEVAAAKARFDQQVEDKKAETSSKIEEWKTNREIAKLEHRAEKAEQYAEDAIILAAYAAAGAEYAMLEAIAARLISEEAASA
jgi:predicted  nucleic acid-binding Zn-ribbon protein